MEVNYLGNNSEKIINESVSAKWRDQREFSELKCKMAGTWEGFTEEDIGFYQKKTEESSKKRPVNFSGKKSVLNKGRGRQISEGKLPEGASQCQDAQETAPLVEGKEEEEREKREAEAGPLVMGSNPVCLKVIEGKAYELVDRNSAEVSKATLEVFEARQKVLEEQNKRRKEMLAKVISARKKQTTEEAKRLQHIQEELQKLDVLLSNDVGILRNKIEEASLDFAEAQKRYNKAEKEFVEAKQNLFAKLEKKELLTKLLCTIIEQNELRKAQKLSELMEKLNINENPNSVIGTADRQSALKDVQCNAETEKPPS